jgi:NADPH:quinone reductase-like Zn-dependent oxidoreductase
VSFGKHRAEAIPWSAAILCYLLAGIRNGGWPRCHAIAVRDCWATPRRHAEALEALVDLGADATIRLEGSDSELEEAFAGPARDGGYDVVLDYLWGRPTEALVAALTGHDVTAESRRTRLIQIGEMAGPIIKLPAAALRSSGLEVMGSGGGSIPPAAIFETFPRLWELAAKGELRIDAEPVPLTDVAEAWQRSNLSGRRLVLFP